MQITLMVLLGLAMLGTLGVLFAGMLGMAREGDGARSNMLMRWRVMLQGAALLLFALLLLSMGR
jgi:hypothetical protein